ncbi:hypothetical protein ACS0TY_023277 [Phlomoides rotata]
MRIDAFQREEEGANIITSHLPKPFRSRNLEDDPRIFEFWGRAPLSPYTNRKPKPEILASGGGRGRWRRYPSSLHLRCLLRLFPIHSESRQATLNLHILECSHHISAILGLFRLQQAAAAPGPPMAASHVHCAMVPHYASAPAYATVHCQDPKLEFFISVLGLNRMWVRVCSRMSLARCHWLMNSDFGRDPQLTELEFRVDWVDSFGCTRGVRQGDPLSPLLFCIAEDVLARLIDRAVVDNEFHPAFALNNFTCPAYLLYADDILGFCKASRRNTRCLKRILDCYASLSGQVFNLDKSKAYFGKHVSVQNRGYFQNTLTIGSAALPFTYLGVPIFRGAPKACHLRGTADRIISKFSCWKGSSLSLVGRACLVNSVIVSSLVHSMMIYKWPRSLLNKID